MNDFLALFMGVAGLYLAVCAKRAARKRRAELEREWEGKRDE